MLPVMHPLPLFALLLAAASPGTASAPASRPAAAPAAEQVYRTLDDVVGTYVEVVTTKTGYGRTHRCGPSDQLIFARAAEGLSMRWSSSPNARTYSDAKVTEGRVVLKEPRRTITLERITGNVLRITFARTNGRTKSYLYGRLEYARDLPKVVDKDNDGCAD